jgi:hypothetical protein
VIENAKKLLDVVVKKIGGEDNALLLNGGASSGFLPSHPGVIESQDSVCLTLRTASSEAKGTLTGFGFLIGGYGIILFLFIVFFGGGASGNWWILFISILIIIIPMAWEMSRPPSLPIVFNRRTQEVYYDMKGDLYYATWDGIEAVAYEYSIVNQYSGSIVHGNLEIILRKFGAPDNRIVLNLSGIPAGKRMRTLVGIWEYLRCFMTIGPWFDENGRRTENRNSFIEKGLASSAVSSLDQLLEGRKLLSKERQEGEGISGTAIIYWFGSYFFFPVAFGEFCIQKIDRTRSLKHWPDVVQERLGPNGPTSRLIDIEEDYMVQKQQELEELHERMRKTLPR